MIPFSKTTCLAPVVSLLLAAPSFAADTAPNLDEGRYGGSQYSIKLGVGAVTRPSYPGASDTEVTVWPIIDVERFYIPGLGQVKDGSDAMNGFNLYPSIGFLGARSPSDGADLTGTDDIDFAFEAGIGARYTYDWFNAFVEIRQGFGGHDGQVGTVGFNVETDVTDQLTFAVGPRLNWGSDAFANTYFGVTAAEAGRAGSVLTAYDADSGFHSAGIEARAEYEHTDRTTFHLRAGWERYIGDAADSPIVKLGDENQFTIGAGISYRFDFDLF